MEGIKRRPPIFKGKAKGINKWVRGYYVKDGNGEWIIQGDTRYRISSDSLSQATGHVDREGDDIFDGDVIEFVDYKTFVGVVEWDDFDGAVRVESSRRKYAFAEGNCNFAITRNDAGRIRIIGHIIDRQ